MAKFLSLILIAVIAVLVAQDYGYTHGYDQGVADTMAIRDAADAANPILDDCQDCRDQVCFLTEIFGAISNMNCVQDFTGVHCPDWVIEGIKGECHD